MLAIPPISATICAIIENPAYLGPREAFENGRQRGPSNVRTTVRIVGTASQMRTMRSSKLRDLR